MTPDFYGPGTATCRPVTADLRRAKCRRRRCQRSSWCTHLQSNQLGQLIRVILYVRGEEVIWSEWTLGDERIPVYRFFWLPSSLLTLVDWYAIIIITVVYFHHVMKERMSSYTYILILMVIVLLGDGRWMACNVRDVKTGSRIFLDVFFFFFFFFFFYKMKTLVPLTDRHALS